MIQPEVIIIVPCYNEAQRLPRQDFIKFAEDYPGYNFLFVNDGSRDTTLEVLTELIEKRPDRFRLLHLEKNGGKAEAVRRGFLNEIQSGVPFLAFWDADLAAPLEILPQFVKIFDDRPRTEIVLGARVKLLGHHIERALIRHYLGRLFATCASWVLDLEVYDTQCGAKMFRVTDTLRQVFEKPFCSRWIFDVEILKRMVRKTGFSKMQMEAAVYEMPLPRWRDVAGSTLKPMDFIKAFAELLRIYWENRP